MKSTIKNVLGATLALVCVAILMVGCDSLKKTTHQHTKKVAERKKPACKQVNVKKVGLLTAIHMV